MTPQLHSLPARARRQRRQARACAARKNTRKQQLSQADVIEGHGARLPPTLLQLLSARAEVQIQHADLSPSVPLQRLVLRVTDHSVHP
jgi:hypothetical protein